MAKKQSLPTSELKLVAWRVGMKLGSAIDHHRHAHWHLREADAAASAKKSEAENHLPFALANEVAMVQDFEACMALAKTLGFKLAPLEGSEECGKLVRRGNRLTDDDVKWAHGFLEAVDKRVEAAYSGIKEHLKKQGEVIVALFDLASRASMTITSPDDPANLSRLASSAGISAACMAPFITAVSAKVERDAMRAEVARLDKCVEQGLLYGDSGETQSA